MRAFCVLAVLVAVANAGELLRRQAAQASQNADKQVAAPAYGQQQGGFGGGQGGGFGSNFINEAFGGGQSNFGGSSGKSQFGGFGSSGNGASFGSSGNGASFGGSQNGASGLGGDIFASGGQFGANFGGGRDGNTPLFRGRVVGNVNDQHQSESDRRDESAIRDARNQSEKISRSDEQERQGDFLESEQQGNQLQDESRARNQNQQHQQKAGLWNLNSRRQNDDNSKHAINIASNGEKTSSGTDSSDSAKALGVKKTAFTNGNLGFEKIDYNFDKDFDQKAAERGGFQEVTGRDNNNEQIYQEKQRDHRTSNTDSSNLRKAEDQSKDAQNHVSAQNARQWKGLENQYGAADRQLDAAGKKAEDFKSYSDKRDDRVWNADVAKDSAYRGAEDLATKNSIYNKDALAASKGAKGVVDNKYYGGAESGNGIGNPTHGWSGEGVQEAAPQEYAGAGGVGARGYGVGAGVVGNADRIGLNGAADHELAGVGGPKVGASIENFNAGPVVGQGIAAGNGKARIEKSGGDIVNAYRENAIQGDLGNQLSNNNAESKANANNNYNRDRGLQDKIEANHAAEGKWAKQQEGFKDARQQGYQGDNANAAKDAEATHSAALDKESSSSLDEENKSLEQAKLDRINQKSNSVKSNQNIKSKKQFYHDKTQGGFNNEGLNYNRQAGNNDFGAQESAQKEARTRGNRLHKNQKNNLENRRFEDADARRISNGEQVYKSNNANNGHNNSYNRASDKANTASRGFNKNKNKQEFDRFNQNNNQHANRNWDKANRDWFTRGAGNQHGRQVQAAFDFNRNGFGRGGQGQARGSQAGSLGTPRFGQTNLGLDQGQKGFYTGDNTGIPGASAVSGKKAAQQGNNIIAPGALAAGNTQFGGQW